jgi:hypothetical protein
MLQAEMVIDKPHVSHIQRGYKATEPTKAQLAETHQNVTLKNVHRSQALGVFDRYNARHEFKPGQEKELDMGRAAIQRLIELGSSDRGVYFAGPKEKIGKPLDDYPIKITSFGTEYEAPKPPPDLSAREMAVRLFELEEREKAMNEKLAARQAHDTSAQHKGKGASSSAS